MLAFLLTPLSCRESVLGGEGMTHGFLLRKGGVTVPLRLSTLQRKSLGPQGLSAALSSPEDGTWLWCAALSAGGLRPERSRLHAAWLCSRLA